MGHPVMLDWLDQPGCQVILVTVAYLAYLDRKVNQHDCLQMVPKENEEIQE